MSFSFADSISTYSENWTLIDSATTCWHSCHQQCQSSSKKKTERNSKRLCDTSYRMATQSNSWPIDSSCKSSLIVLYFLKNNTKWHKRKNIQEIANTTIWKLYYVSNQTKYSENAILVNNGSHLIMTTIWEMSVKWCDSRSNVKIAETHTRNKEKSSSKSR